MTDAAKIAEIVKRFTNVREHGRYVVVPTFSYYPSNAMVRVFVEGEGDSFVVSDGGGALDTLHGAGGYSVPYTKFINVFARKRNFKLSSEGWLVSPRVTSAQLTGAITETVEVSKVAAEILLKHFRAHLCRCHLEEQKRLASPDTARVADREAIEFDYTNWEGKRGHRRAIPISIRYGRTQWHPKPGLLLLALDLDKNEEREFAMADMEFDGDQSILSLLDKGGATPDGGEKQ